MQTIKRIDVGSAALMTGVTYALIGLIAGIFLAIFGGILGSAGRDAGLAGAGLGFFGIILLPIGYGIAGLIGGALGAVIYNVVSGMIGGVKVELQ